MRIPESGVGHLRDVRNPTDERAREDIGSIGERERKPQTGDVKTAGSHSGTDVDEDVISPWSVGSQESVCSDFVCSSCRVYRLGRQARRIARWPRDRPIHGRSGTQLPSVAHGLSRFTCARLWVTVLSV
jgi:hypothetical protein